VRSAAFLNSVNFLKKGQCRCAHQLEMPEKEIPVGRNCGRLGSQISFLEKFYTEMQLFKMKL
jgi:hypothetical protein